MSKAQKSNTLYSHPFSKAYWRDAAAELKDTHMLVFAALMIALRLVMKQVSIPITPVLRINTAFFVNALGAMVFGPVMAAICGRSRAAYFTAHSEHSSYARPPCQIAPRWRPPSSLRPISSSENSGLLR